MAAINAYARVALFEIVLPPYYDAAVSGADPIDARPGFRALLTYLAEHPDVRAILVENASRFARRTQLPPLASFIARSEVPTSACLSATYPRRWRKPVTWRPLASRMGRLRFSPCWRSTAAYTAKSNDRDKLWLIRSA
jgi:hypothetical protein